MHASKYAYIVVLYAFDIISYNNAGVWERQPPLFVKCWYKGGRALSGEFGPLWSQKLKITFHQFYPIDLLEEWSKCKILAFILLFPLLW